MNAFRKQQMGRPTRVIHTGTNSNAQRLSLCATFALVLIVAAGAIAQPAPIARRISAGSTHTLAVLPDGTVKAWGSNSYGQLGLGNTSNQLAPQTIPGLSGVTAVSAGGDHSFALLANGTVMAWGHNNNGQLGLGSVTNHYSPQPIPGLTGVTALAAGPNGAPNGAGHSLALLANGSVKA